jgi:23S rRNA (guanosine2251-2'-O)-methyltransferase
MARKRHHPGRQQVRGPGARRKGGADNGPSPWLYGIHAVLAALGNPARVCDRILVGDDEVTNLAMKVAARMGRVQLIERMGRDDIAHMLPAGAVHQNIAMLAEPLEQPSLGEALDRAGEQECVLVLDQVTDPQNVGAIIRSAAAFGVRSIIMQDRNAPRLSGALAKAASGGLEHVAVIYETNLARTLDLLKQDSFWCVGLAGEGEQTVVDACTNGRLAIVLGAEGSGLRRLVRESCDALARIPQTGAVESLNVSNAAAVALYEFAKATANRA